MSICSSESCLFSLAFLLGLKIVHASLCSCAIASCSPVRQLTDVKGEHYRGCRIPNQPSHKMGPSDLYKIESRSRGGNLCL
ncbi:hypothetical protein CC78DRAFT_131585 [Lojkania enalia]|uniref:Secreted protein n=1 Tax=Lojkania enalia TaxID=147567 RepID=A0A9P4NBX2_9PLEO|nr:hypothetical protein CC78DRAFT_131585 [Didymosphaeria enalia]